MENQQYTQTQINIADAIYARRCDAHVLVKHDCPYANKFLPLLPFSLKKKMFTRSIPPYCTKWCDFIGNPAAFLKDSNKQKQG